MELVKIENGKSVTTSLLVAKVFSKEHKNVMRDIESLDCSPEFNKLNFERIEYLDSRNRRQLAFKLTKDGFSFLVMGYTSEKAAQFKEQFISEFNKREALLNSDEYILIRSQQILSKRIEIAEHQLQLANDVIKKQAPKVQYHDNVLQSDGLIAITEIAKELGFTSGKALNAELKKLGVQYMINGCWVLAAKFIGKELTKTKTYTYTDEHGNTKTSRSMYWTEKGRAFLHGLFDPKQEKYLY